MASTNPFEPPRPERSEPWQPPRPGWAALGWFLFRRGLLAIVAPVLVTLAAIVAAWPVWWILAAAGSLVWLPTTTMILWARFAGRLVDDRPVVLANGMVLDRDRYHMLVRANAIDRVILAVLLVTVSLSLATWGGMAWLMVVSLWGLAFWMVWFAGSSLRVAAATVAFFSEDYEAAERRLQRVVRWRRMNWPFVDHCHVSIASARLRQRDPAGALRALSRVHRRRRQAHLVRAQVLIGQGRVDEARTAMAGRDPRNLGERLAWTFAQVLLAMEEGRGLDAVGFTDDLRDLRTRVPPHARVQLDLLEAAALQSAADTVSARRRLAETQARPGDREWIAATWPTWWSLLQEIPSEAGQGSGT